jgi:hypothetical protein
VNAAIKYFRPDGSWMAPAAPAFRKNLRHLLARAPAWRKDQTRLFADRGLRPQ